MARFSTPDARRMQDLAGDLATIRDGAPSALSWLVSGLRDVLGADKAACAVYAPRGDGMCLESGYTDRIRSGLIDATDRFLADKTVGWTAFHPMRPDPKQRNVALTLSEVTEVTGVKNASILTEVYGPFGLLADDQLRVLVCEGPSLLAWIGLFQRAPFDARQKRMLAHLVRPIRRRLSAERLLGDASTTRALLDAALGALPAPVFVFDRTRALRESNAAGAAWLDGDRRARSELLNQAVRRRGSPGRFEVIEVNVNGATVRYLVIVKGDPSAAHAFQIASVKWGFSRREAAVFALLARGLTNRAIAADLAIAERTVEAHLTSMFEKAQVETRAELVVSAIGTMR